MERSHEALEVPEEDGNHSCQIETGDTGVAGPTGTKSRIKTAELHHDTRLQGGGARTHTHTHTHTHRQAQCPQRLVCRRCVGPWSVDLLLQMTNASRKLFS